MRTFITFVAVIGLMLAGIGGAIVRQQWFYSFKLVEGVKVVQRPFKHSYDIHTTKGLVIEDVFGWVIRHDCVYGAYARGSYFLIDRQNGIVTHFSDLGELNVVLKARGLSRYDMNDEENISHLKYHGGRDRKYR